MFKNWRRTFKPFLLEGKYRVIPAFKLDGKSYYMFEDVNHVPTGRMLASVMIYNEMQMKVDREYLEMHCRAMDKMLSDPKKIDLQNIMRLNMFLKERLDLMVLPDFVFKLASVIYFDAEESPYDYDIAYNDKKIAAWKTNKDALAFFLQTPVAELIPSWNAQSKDIKTYLGIADQVAEIHRRLLSDISLEKT